MRLLQVRDVIKRNIELLSIDVKAIPNSPNARVTSFKNAIDAIVSLRSTGMLQKQTMTILNQSQLVEAVEDFVVVSANTASDMFNQIKELKSSATLILRSLNEFLGDDPDDSISVKLPASNRLDDTAKVIIQINKAFEQALVNEHLQGKIELRGFDRGTNWLIIYVGSFAALQFLGGIINLIYMCKNKEAELSHKKEMIRHIKVQNDAKDACLQALDNELKEYSESQMDNLLAVNATMLADNEYRNRVLNTVKILNGLIAKGLEVHPSLSAPKEERNIFPDPQKVLEALKALPVSADGSQGTQDELDGMNTTAV